jgi:hypothetical protein
MKKEEVIKHFGQQVYNRKLASAREWKRKHPKIVREHSHQSNRKGGKYYIRHLQYQHSGLQGERNKIRAMHARRWSKYKNRIAPNSQIHHAWRHNSSDFDGVALVETNAHRHGVIDVILILEGNVTLLIEENRR